MPPPYRDAIGRGFAGGHTVDDDVQLRLFVTGADDVPIVFSNMAIVQHERQEFILTFAQYSPPLVLGDAAEQREQLEAMPYLPVNVVARIGMTPDRLREFIQILQENYDAFQEKHRDA